MMADMMRTQVLMNLLSKETPVRNWVLFQAWETATRWVPTYLPILHRFCCQRNRRSIQSVIQQQTKHVNATIACERIFMSSTAKQQPLTNQTRMDAVIHHITTLPVVRNLLSITHSDYLPHDFEPIIIEPDLYFELTDLRHSEGNLEMIKFKLYCYEHPIQYIQQFVEKCNTEYERKQLNKLGTSLYYFDMITQSKSKKSIQNPLPGSHILYTRHKFHTTRTFDNVFFEQKSAVQSHVEFFLNRKDWYEKKGIPYTLGFMFHGEPGVGKTSTIKAISNISRRHIINIHLSQVKTKDQLRHLFFNDEINVYDGQKTEKFVIPVHERLYVIEDIDAMGDAVLRREFKKEEPKIKITTDDAWLDRQKESESEQEPIDLAFLLNLLDGTLEASGRILAISSNHPERIDRALIRPGRIDMIVHFKKCNRQILCQMVDTFYDQTFPDWTTPDLDYKWSPAEVNQILFRNFKSPETALQELIDLAPHELSGIRETDSVTFET